MTGRAHRDASEPDEGSMTNPSEAMQPFAWTPGSGAYRHYPQYINLTPIDDGRLRVTVRAPEYLNGEHYQMGQTASIDLPSEVAIELCASMQAATPAAPVQDDDALVALWNYATDWREHPTFEGFVKRAQELGLDAQTNPITVQDAEWMRHFVTAYEADLSPIARSKLLEIAARLTPDRVTPLVEALRRIRDRAIKLRTGTDDWFELVEFEAFAANALRDGGFDA